MNIEFKPIWFDSLGAKSSCTLVRTCDVTVLIDPGIAIMQPSFPAPTSQKLAWASEGRKAIREACKKADVIVISHYHHDHFFPNEMDVYSNKLILAKNPNHYINDSQRARAESFYSKICEAFGNVRLTEVLRPPRKRIYEDPLNSLPLAMKLDVGDYKERRREVLERGKEWFRQRIEKWNKWPQIPELNFGKVKILFPEGKELKLGRTRLRFTNPLFHGVEFSRVGWVFMTIIEFNGVKLIHTSDVNGPIIEDYAELIIRENPDILILDGPMTYMLGYMLNRTNLNRAIKNAVRIIKETTTKLIIYDHHLPREARFKERTRNVWDTAEKHGKRVITAAEFLGKKPKVLEIAESL